MQLQQLIQPALDFERKVDALPDSPRARFVQLAARAALLAIQVDAPKREMRDVQEQNLAAMKAALDEWADEETT
jgi:hypothetical protein